VLSEEALIFVAGLAALGALALGVLELLWPTRPKHPVRRVSVPPAEPPPPPPIASSVASPRRWRSSRRRHARKGERLRYRRRQPTEPVTVALRAAFEEEPLPAPQPVVAVTPRRVPIAAVAPAPTDVDVVDHCFAL